MNDVEISDDSSAPVTQVPNTGNRDFDSNNVENYLLPLSLILILVKNIVINCKK